MKRLLVLLFLALSSSTVYCQEWADKLEDFSIDVQIDFGGGSLLRISSEYHSSEKDWPSEGYLLVLNNGGPFEERYFLKQESKSNTFELQFYGAGGSMSFNNAVLESGFYNGCVGKKYGEATIKKGSLDVKFNPALNSNISSFILFINL